MRFFNTAGPVNCEDHYCLPPLSRFNLDEILSLIGQKKYFVLHAPRQTGKTSCLMALMDHLGKEGRYRCVYVNVEIGQSAREDVTEAMTAILNETASSAEVFAGDEFPRGVWREILQKSGAHAAFGELLSQWARQEPEKPLILLIDEIDALVGDTLISVLRQLRAGYTKRPVYFPQSVILCGVRDVRDYRIHSDREKSIITGGSAFNIRAESLRLGNLSREEADRLYDAHTEETGQVFETDATDQAWEFTKGQPWLVNALGYETCFRMEEGKDRSVPITGEMMIRAKEKMILRRETHLDQLADKLTEKRVRRVIGPVIEGSSFENISPDDIQYLLDLGLLSQSDAGLEIANAIYREIIPRELTAITQRNLEPLYRPSWYILPDGRLDAEKLLEAFQGFFRENADAWVQRFDYREAGPQLLLQAFLQRIVNSGGRIAREYGLGRKRTDLMVEWPHEKGVQKAVIELKILYKSLERTVAEGLKQTADYMDKCGSDDGHLIVFDRREGRKWEEKIFRKVEGFEGKRIVVWGM